MLREFDEGKDIEGAVRSLNRIKEKQMKQEKWKLINDEFADIRRRFDEIEKGFNQPNNQVTELKKTIGILEAYIKDLKTEINYAKKEENNYSFEDLLQSARNTQELHSRGLHIEILEVKLKKALERVKRLEETGTAKDSKIQRLETALQTERHDYYNYRVSETPNTTSESFGSYALAIAGTVFVILGFWKLVELFVLLFI